MDKIIKISNKYKIIIIEDCAQAQGAKYKNRYVGTFGHLSCFSFYPTKILGTYGDGGFIACNNKKLLSEVTDIVEKPKIISSKNSRTTSSIHTLHTIPQINSTVAGSLPRRRR